MRMRVNSHSCTHVSSSSPYVHAHAFALAFMHTCILLFIICACACVCTRIHAYMYPLLLICSCACVCTRIHAWHSTQHVTQDDDNDNGRMHPALIFNPSAACLITCIARAESESTTSVGRFVRKGTESLSPSLPAAPSFLFPSSPPFSSTSAHIQSARWIGHPCRQHTPIATPIFVRTHKSIQHAFLAHIFPTQEDGFEPSAQYSEMDMFQPQGSLH